LDVGPYAKIHATIPCKPYLSQNEQLNKENKTEQVNKKDQERKTEPVATHVKATISFEV